ncbi:MAG: hypothetical protein IIV41_06755 [Akkermansia sp.]|nr:hypothetical protein [Akkermansia sp.]
MNATEQAYGLLGEDGYTALCLEVISTHGTLVQDKEFMLAFRVEHGVAHVLFACGNLKKILRFAHQNKGVFGYTRASWVRSLVGKHEDLRTYDIDRL